ncbi:invasion protein [Nocardioides aromaticivorans]|uniref:Invasion protein n=1 Tax=Nocardioides aromaticivorans TaxID=200618 RepID=A0ABX7PQY9_9ACTN|nr:DoxX family protein [Nocardioides aromaticivorans]QSR28429.1 invasion protein [Nocardioides aromaticivorans]
MTATAVLTAVLAVPFTAIGAAKLAAVPSMRARAAHVGLSVGAYRVIGALEVAAAAGLVAGFAVPLLRTSAALGLLLLLVGAVVAHLRVKDGLREMAPAIGLGVLAAAVLALSVLGA